jgi:hypothetical protein
MKLWKQDAEAEVILLVLFSIEDDYACSLAWVGGSTT